MLCPICSHWAGSIGEFVNVGHHAECPDHPGRMRAARDELLSVCKELLKLHTPDTSDPEEVVRPLVCLNRASFERLKAAVEKAEGRKAALDDKDGD